MNAGGGHLLPGAGFLGGLQENLQWGEKGLITTNVIISVITILVIKQSYHHNRHIHECNTLFISEGLKENI